MLNREQTDWLRPVTTTLQIICGALIFGAIGASIVLFVVNSNCQFNDSLGLIPLLGITMGLASFGAAIIIPRIILKDAARKFAKSANGVESSQLSESAIRMLFDPLQQSTIIRYALFEGPVFANLMFWFMQGSVYNLATAGTGIMLMILFFPFPNRIIQWVESLIDNAKQP